MFTAVKQAHPPTTVDFALPCSLVAGGRDYITSEDLHACLDKDTAAFLLSRMDGLDLGLDYKAFAHKVYPNHLLTLARTLALALALALALTPTLA